MSEPTLTGEQRETLAAAIKDSFYEARDQGRTMHQAAEDPRIGAVVAAMLAAERAAREAAEAKVRRNRAALAALRLRESDKALAECEQDLAAAIVRAEAAEAKVRDLTSGVSALAARTRNEPCPTLCESCDLRGRISCEFGEGRPIVHPRELRALVDDPAAAQAKVRAEALEPIRAVAAELTEAGGSIHGPVVDEVRRTIGSWLIAVIDDGLRPTGGGSWKSPDRAEAEAAGR